MSEAVNNSTLCNVVTTFKIYCWETERQTSRFFPKRYLIKLSPLTHLIDGKKTCNNVNSYILILIKICQKKQSLNFHIQ